jgi:hypothetical protein
MRFAFLLGVGLALAGCSHNDQGPVLASSAGEPAYALGYADELGASVTASSDGPQQEQKLTSGFGARIDALKKPDWDLVRAVVDQSDATGKSADFFDAHGEVDGVRTFWQAEKATIDARVAGGAQYPLKDAPCTSDCTNLDVGGAAAYALNEAMDKQIQKRLRASNNAYVLIDRQRAALGTQNATALEKLADDVAEASYITHVGLVVSRQRLERLLADKSAVQATLDHFVQDEKSYQAQPGRTDAEKKACDQRIAEASKGKLEIDAAATQAEAALKSADQTIAATARDYDDALKTLRDKIDQKKKGT